MAEDTRQLAAVGEDGLHLYTCPLCEAMCGLEVRVEQGRVAGIRPNKHDVWSRGHICPKGASLGALHEDPDRIRRPMVKVDGQWREVDWDTAFRRCSGRVTVTSTGGCIAVPVEVTDAIKPGVVSMPHGWGHGKPGTRLGVANGSPGVNTNILSPVDFLDEPSGNGALNGIPVSVNPVR